MQTRFNVDEIYPELGGFFGRIQVAKAPANVLVQEFKAALRNARPYDNLPRIYSILDDVCDLVRKSSSSTASIQWLSQLAQMAVLPVRDPLGRVRLARIMDDFFVPDESGELAALFADSCTLLCISDNLPLIRLKYLLDCPQFSNHVKSLEDCVRIEVDPVGTPIYQEQVSDEFSSRIPYIRW